MARNTKATETKKPTHNLIVRTKDENGVPMIIGRIGLFEGNGLHELLIEADNEELVAMSDYISFEIEEFSDERKSSKPKLAFMKAK